MLNHHHHHPPPQGQIVKAFKEVDAIAPRLNIYKWYKINLVWQPPRMKSGAGKTADPTQENGGECGGPVQRPERSRGMSEAR